MLMWFSSRLGTSALGFLLAACGSDPEGSANTGGSKSNPEPNTPTPMLGDDDGLATEDGDGAEAGDDALPPGPLDGDGADPTDMSMTPQDDVPMDENPPMAEDDAGASIQPDPPQDLPPPLPGEYGSRADLLEANSEMAVAELDGVIYVVGGYPSSREVQTTVQAYTIASDSWDFARPHPIPIHHPVVKGVAGKLYSLGGQEDTGRSFAYDPSAAEWTEIASMPTARGGGAAAVIDDQIYVVGGRPPAGNAFEVYDVSDDAWTQLPPLPQDYDERNHLAAAAIGGKVYVAGGRYDGGGFGSPRTDALDVFDPVAGEWSRAAPMLRPRGGNNGVAAYGCFYTWGGEGQDIGEPNDVYPDHDVYNPVTDEWRALDPLPTPIHGVTGAAFVDGLIYMPGGGTQSGGSSGSVFFQVYRPDVRCDQ